MTLKRLHELAPLEANREYHALEPRYPGQRFDYSGGNIFLKFPVGAETVKQNLLGPDH
jgi:hypothetical protein